MRVKVLTEQEVQALLTHLEKCPLRDQVIIRLMLQCGLRIGEVSGLNVENVWRGGYVHPAVHLPQGTTKGHIARYVDIPGPLRELLARYIDTEQRQYNAETPSSPLFIGEKRRARLRVSGIGRIVAAISMRALGRAINPHMLRHTYATTLLRYTNLRVVQTLLGHSKVTSTEIYTHPTSEECKTAVDRAFTQ